MCWDALVSADMVDKVAAENGTFMMHMWKGSGGNASADETHDHFADHGIDFGYYLPHAMGTLSFSSVPLGAVINLRTGEVTGVWVGASNGDLLDAWDKILDLVKEANNG